MYLLQDSRQTNSDDFHDALSFGRCSTSDSLLPCRTHKCTSVHSNIRTSVALGCEIFSGSHCNAQLRQHISWTSSVELLSVSDTVRMHAEYGQRVHSYRDKKTFETRAGHVWALNTNYDTPSRPIIEGSLASAAFSHPRARATAYLLHRILE